MDLPLGFETNVTSADYVYSNLTDAHPDGPLVGRVKSLGNDLELSGGQWQRLAIARTFFRGAGDDSVRLMCFDEPSSALDPKAEFGES